MVVSAKLRGELRDGWVGNAFVNAGPINIRCGVVDFQRNLDYWGGAANVSPAAYWRDGVNPLRPDMGFITPNTSLAMEEVIPVTAPAGRPGEFDASVLDKQFFEIDVTDQVNYILSNSGQFALVFLTGLGEGSTGKINLYAAEDGSGPGQGSDNPWTTDGNTTHLFCEFVAGIGNAPQFISAPPTSATEDSLYSYSITVADVDTADTVTLSLTDGPSGMTLNGNVLTWTPLNADVGFNDVALRVQDNNGNSTTQSFSITVLNTNDPPMITSTGPTVASEGLAYQYQIQVSDPDQGDAVTYQLVTSPTGMTVSTGGLISWTPTSAQIGNNDVQIAIEDASGTADSQSFQIDVANVNNAPTFTTIALDSGVEDQAYVDTIMGTNSDGNLVFWSLINPARQAFTQIVLSIPVRPVISLASNFPLTNHATVNPDNLEPVNNI